MATAEVILVLQHNGVRTTIHQLVLRGPVDIRGRDVPDGSWVAGQNQS